MNSNQLNSAELGSASTLPGTYIRGALAVYAVAVAMFSTVGYQQVYGEALARVSAVGLFGAVFSVKGSTTATVSSTWVTRAIAYLQSSTLAQAVTVAAFAVGRGVVGYGRVTTFAVGRWTSRVQKTVNAFSLVYAEMRSRFGIRQISFGSTEPTIEVSARFTTFGDYAPEGRYILVQTEDRKATVV